MIREKSLKRWSYNESYRATRPTGLETEPDRDRAPSATTKEYGHCDGEKKAMSFRAEGIVLLQLVCPIVFICVVNYIFDIPVHSLKL